MNKEEFIQEAAKKAKTTQQEDCVEYTCMKNSFSSIASDSSCFCAGDSSSASKNGCNQVDGAVETVDNTMKRVVSNILLTGAAGTGKTSLAEYYAAQNNAEVVYYLCHEWTTAEDMLWSIDVGKVALKDPSPYKRGALAYALKLSQEKRVVLIVDEIDKARERIDTLLLDFLQNCRIQKPDNGLEYGNINNITVFITSNERRELIDPLMRRLFKINMGFLSINIELNLLVQQDDYHIDEQRAFVLKVLEAYAEPQANNTLQKLVMKIASRLRQAECDISLSELKAFYLLLGCCGTVKEVEYAIQGWIVRNEEYMEVLDKAFRGIKNLANALWGVRNG